MEKGIKNHYYEEGDELNILVGRPRECKYVEIEDEIYVRVDPVTREILGVTITNFAAKSRRGEEMVPLYGHFSLPQKMQEKVFAKAR